MKNIVPAIQYKIKKTLKQVKALELISQNTFVLLEGGGRSGKTFIALFCIVVRALLCPNSAHLVVRFRFAHAKKTICMQTMPKLLRTLGLIKLVTLNKTDWFYQFKTGSTIWVAGIDDKERLENILGSEFSTIYINEASQVSYDAVEILMTRLNPSPGLSPKMIFDYNPPSINHWGFKIFHKREFPDGSKVPINDYQWIQMNPVDNSENLSKAYFDILDKLSESKKKRFLYGEYSLDDGVLWKRKYFKNWSKDLPYFYRVVIGVDPAGSVEGDAIGLIVVGMFGDEFIVLEDATLHGTPKEWSDEIWRLWNKWKADCVVAEKNFGGDMVDFTIRSNHPQMNVKLVTSSRGKIVRAEPISALYENGKVYHYQVVHNENGNYVSLKLLELEDELCMYKPGEKSPNRMDALVFGITELAGEGLSILDVLGA